MVNKEAAAALHAALKRIEAESKDVAQTIGVQPEAVRQWRRGARRVPAEWAVALEKSYGVPRWLTRPDLWTPPRKGARLRAWTTPGPANANDDSDKTDAGHNPLAMTA